MIPYILITALTGTITTTTFENQQRQCQWLDLLQSNITEMKKEGYSRQYILEHTISEDGETSSEEDQVLIHEAVRRVYDNKYSEEICGPE